MSIVLRSQSTQRLKNSELTVARMAENQSPDSRSLVVIKREIVSNGESKFMNILGEFL